MQMTANCPPNCPPATGPLGNLQILSLTPVDLTRKIALVHFAGAEQQDRINGLPKQPAILLTGAAAAGVIRAQKQSRQRRDWEPTDARRSKTTGIGTIFCMAPEPFPALPRARKTGIARAAYSLPGRFHLLNVLTISGVIFALIAVGYLAVLRKIFSGADLRVLGQYVINFALPALIFRAVSGRDLSEVLNAGYLIAYLAASVGVFFLGYHLAKRGFGMTRIESAFLGMGMSCSNSGFIGYPIVLMALPSVAATALALNMIIESIIMIPLVLIMAERANGGGKMGPEFLRRIADRVLRNPLIIGLVLGMVVSFSGLELPEVIAKPINLLASSSAAVSLIVIGGTLAGLPLGAINLKIAAVVIGKLVILPLVFILGLAAVTAVGIGTGDPVLETAGILMAATPAMAIYPILAQSYGQENTAALAMFAMTVASFFSLSALMWWLNVGAV